MNNDDFIDIESTPEEETLDALKRRGLIPASKKLEDLTNAERSILDIKAAKEKNEKNLIQKVYKIGNCLNIRFGFYFIFNFLFLIFFWYYLGCFCAVYKNTQNHLIKDTILSFGLSLLYPFGLSIIPGLFRIPALNAPKHDKECFYKFSQIIQLI